MEVGSINRQKFIAELSKLLGFMSSWDREATIAEYNAMFDATDNEAELLGTLGSPTRLAITLANHYVPSPAPAKAPVEEIEIAETEEDDDLDMALAVAQAVALATGDDGETPECDAAEGLSEEAEVLPEHSHQQKPRRLRPLLLILYCPFALAIGLPVAVLLIALGIPFLLSGGALGAATVWCALEVLSALTMVSDILMVAGLGMALLGLSLFLLWLGLWLSIKLGCVWLGGVVFGLGARLCFKKEVAAE